MEFGKALSFNISQLIFRFMTILFETILSSTISPFFGANETELIEVATALVIDLIGEILENGKME